MKTLEFFTTHPVFSLDEANKALAPPGGRSGTVERLKYHLETGRLKLVNRGVYAVVPPGGKAEEFLVGNDFYVMESCACPARSSCFN